MEKMRKFFCLGLLLACNTPQINSYEHHDTFHQHSEAIPAHDTVHFVDFTNDICNMVELDLLSNSIDNTLSAKEVDCINYFKTIPVIVRAAKEYETRDGDEVSVETVTAKNWEISFENLSNAQLLSLGTFRDVVSEYFIPKDELKRFLTSWIKNVYFKMQFYVFSKVIARFAKTSFTIHADIKDKADNCILSDIILDIDGLAAKDKLAIDIQKKNLFGMHMHVTLKEIA